METRDALWFILYVFFLIFFQPSMAIDTISLNDSISGDKTIVSSKENFKLGFFTPGKSSSSSSKYYIGIWYNKISVQTVVWVANRDTPISDPSVSFLKFQNGNLVLLNESRFPVWSTNISSKPPFGSLQATIQDDGNFVLKDGSITNSSKPLWQSFDFPTDTWLPGSKLGRNEITKQTQHLTSWKNPEDPGSGHFSLELDPNGTSAYLIMWNRTREYWSSGPWVANMFSLVPEMRLNYIYNFSFVETDTESYFTYSMYNSSVISRFVMDVSGQAKQFTWLESSKNWNLFWGQPRQQCEVYALCGAFGRCIENTSPICSCVEGFEPNSNLEWDLKEYSGGCRRKTKLKCENPVSNGDRDRFLLMPYMKLPDLSESVPVGNGGDCESSCLHNCSCVAYSYQNGQCATWSGDLLDLRQLSQNDPSARPLYLKLAASEFSSRKKNTGVIIGVAVGAAVGLVIVLAVLTFILLRRRRIVGKGKTVEGSLVAFEYRDLLNATKNFSHKLGGGGFGSVFKGSLSDSTIVAVKKLESVSQGEKQFRTEVSTIGTIQHVNLIRLRGFCSEGSKKLLVYDYMPNGSLDSHIFHNQNPNNVLEWKTRYQIALGTARGLAYLHEKCRECIVHCDIKPENILLDDQFCPKVADFGLAKLFGREFSRVLTTMRGTRGYLAPEWISGVAITAKADVFSYGMMLFEFVSGRRNSEQSEDGTIKFFPSVVGKVITEEGDILGLLDPKLQGNADVKEVTKICRVACWCIQDEEVQRPSMSNIVQILEGVLEVNKPPLPRSLLAFSDSQEHLVFFTESSSSSSSNQNSKTNSSTPSSQTKSSTSTTNS
ncbi:hypothetical protein IC582_000402 [Cucumis melo]|uniref:Receptor-like serine/threonine-protein kinase n=2 Tax=Cucumis melo TaxID=3656 RepID=A0A1S3C0Q9_CUCME|nr:G-type lectin S-receptor-like serine/threonine-protein kinase At2g19130 [Cucumis melo]KAA0031611.1 G-type lectin S-receptor-like serine/threonine-protein kinase [Cucumis melo var. makuwa]